MLEGAGDTEPRDIVRGAAVDVVAAQPDRALGRDRCR